MKEGIGVFYRYDTILIFCRLEMVGNQGVSTPQKGGKRARYLLVQIYSSALLLSPYLYIIYHSIFIVPQY